MTHKTMRVGRRETCVGLEPQFWAYLAELAAERRVSVKALVGQVAAAHRRQQEAQEQHHPEGLDEVA